MRIIRPITVTDSILIASNVPEIAYSDTWDEGETWDELDPWPEPPEYDGTTEYALGDVVGVTSNDDIIFYESLQASNTGHTPSSSPTWWMQIGTGQVYWDSGTTYLIGETVTYNHKLYECLIQNTNKQPDLYTGGATPNWLDLGYTNRFKMFDDKVQSQTIRPESITFVLQPSAIIDSIAFLDVEGSSIEITMSDPTEGVVYHEYLDLVTKSAIIDGYTYFFEPIVLEDAAVLLGIPPYLSAIIEITILNPGGDAKIGTCAIGTQKLLGQTSRGASFRIIDYSKKEEDPFGNFYVLERSFSKEMNAEITMEMSSFDDINKTLTSYRARPVIWVGTDVNLSSFIIYGFWRDFQNVASGPFHATCSIKVLGLS